jgi:hypothetical protein
MFRVLLYSQWKWSRLIVVLGAVVAFVLPILSIQGATASVRPGELLQTVQSWGVLYPALAATLAVLVAIMTWAPDHRGRHVHALSLPVPRWRYALLRFGAGLTLLATPVLALLVGAVLATSIAHIPPGLQGYPYALAVRFALAVGIGYSIFFAISAGTSRTAGVLLAVVATLIIAQVLASVANVNLDLAAHAQVLLLNWPGPLAVFTGRWMLIDV